VGLRTSPEVQGRREKLFTSIGIRTLNRQARSLSRLRPMRLACCVCVCVCDVVCMFVVCVCVSLRSDRLADCNSVTMQAMPAAVSAQLLGSCWSVTCSRNYPPFVETECS